MGEVLNKIAIKTCELDPLPSSLPAKLVDDLLSITSVINDSLLTWSFPSVFRSSVAWPLLKLKSLDTENAKNYRPVSNLPFLSKIARKSALLQLSQHLQSSNLFYPLQSVYRSGHIIETALLKIDNDLIIALDVSQISLLPPYDLSAVFVLSTTQFCCSVSIILLEFLALLCLSFSHYSVLPLRLDSGCLY